MRLTSKNRPVEIAPVREVARPTLVGRYPTMRSDSDSKKTDERRIVTDGGEPIPADQLDAYREYLHDVAMQDDIELEIKPTPEKLRVSSPTLTATGLRLWLEHNDGDVIDAGDTDDGGSWVDVRPKSAPVYGERDLDTEIIDPETDLKLLRVFDGEQEVAMVPWGEALQIAAAVEKAQEATA